MNDIIANYKAIEVLKNNFLITDIWRGLLSFNRIWDNTISSNLSINQKLMIDDVKQDIKKYISLSKQIKVKDWILLCNKLRLVPLINGGVIALSRIFKGGRNKYTNSSAVFISFRA